MMLQEHIYPFKVVQSSILNFGRKLSVPLVPVVEITATVKTLTMKANVVLNTSKSFVSKLHCTQRKRTALGSLIGLKHRGMRRNFLA
jgi:hypothetical protein